MNKSQADLMLNVHLFPTEAGGRRSNTPSNSFKCIFKIFEELHDCQLVLDATGALKPGQNVTVPARLLNPESLKDRIKQGQTFKLCEGHREVGEGTVSEVLLNGCRNL
jgi:translation elongation factor EF-Tu-like GTPase